MELVSPARNPGDLKSRLAARGVELTPEDEALMEFVFGSYKENKAFRANFDKDWDRWFSIYFGHQWPANRPEWRSDPVINYTFATIETILPIMTDSDPQITIAAQEPNDLEIASIHSHIQKNIWRRNKMRDKIVKWAKYGLIAGDGIIKCWYNSEACDGEGDVEYSLVDNRHFFPSPGAMDVQGAANVIYAANLPINSIEEMYPEAKGKIESGVWEEDLDAGRSFASSGSSGIQTGPIAGTDGTSTLSNTSWAKGSSNAMNQKHERGKIATLIEMWHRINGKIWVTVFCNGVKLKHSPSPFDHDFFPFIKWSNYPIPGSFWSMGEVQQLESLQKFINARRGQTQDLLRICCNPPVVADANSGINPKAMTGRPGVILYKNQGTEVHWMQPPNIPGALFQVQQMDKADFDSISGIYDVTKGKDPGGIEAAKAITALQDAAHTRVRLKVRNIETAIQSLGEQSVPLVQQYYTDERTIRITGGNSNEPQYMTINKQNGIDNSGNSVKINNVAQGKYDVEVGVGSTMPVNKTARAMEMKELLQLGVVDAQAVLDHSTLSPSDVNKITQRMQQAQQAQMQMEQGMVAPEEGAQGPPPPVDESEIAQLEAEAQS